MTVEEIVEPSHEDSPDQWRNFVGRSLRIQRDIEKERSGAQKLTAKLVLIFGSIITTAAIGIAMWGYNSQMALAEQASDIEQLETNPAGEHGHESIEVSVRNAERRIYVLERSTEELRRTMTSDTATRQSQYDDILIELRRVNTRRR